MIIINTLYFNVFKQKITLRECCSKTIVASKAKKYVVANFSFDDPDWIDKKVTAIFKNSNVSKSYSQIIGSDTELKSCECYVPWEVLDKRGTLSVSVSAGNLMTTISASVIVRESGYTEGETPQEPTPTVYEQILAKLDEIEKDAVPPEVVTETVKKYLEENSVIVDSYTKVQTDSKIITAVEEIKKIIPVLYDDTQIKESLSQLSEDLGNKQNTATLEDDVKSIINKSYIQTLIRDGNEVGY